MDANADGMTDIAAVASRATAMAALHDRRAVLLVARGSRIVLPFVANDYWTLIGTRAAVYWVLVSGLNLAVGFGGQLAIGYVALLTLGAYTASILVLGNLWSAVAAATPRLPPRASWARSPA